MPRLFGTAQQAPGWQGVRFSQLTVLHKSAITLPSLQHAEYPLAESRHVADEFLPQGMTPTLITGWLLQQGVS